MLLLLLSWTLAGARLQFGSLTLNHNSAPMLMNPLHLEILLANSAALGGPGGVGGIAFDQVAVPESGLSVSSLTLNFQKDSADGRRLWLRIGDKQVHAPIYDWQLIPIARFADSPYFSCFTYFGKLDDPTEEKLVEDGHGHILNYHPALVNTLLGLRLFQADILILRQYCTDLPREGGQYVLGAGETPPDTDESECGMFDFAALLNRIENDLKIGFRSYVICDYNQNVRFHCVGDSLVIAGEPIYYCWRYRMEMPDYDKDAVRERIERELTDECRAARQLSPQDFDENEWCIDRALEVAKAYAGKFDFYAPGSTLLDLLDIKDDDARRAHLRGYYPSAIKQMVVETRLGMDAYQVVYLKEYSERLSQRPEVIRSINPAVWDALVNVMRYAAFFRYCKQQFPEQWQAFMKQIDQLEVLPRVSTPTVMYDPDEQGRER
ncbi:MAG: hypothetical protein NTX53_07885 [candidate division WOR-3 bacterium]|nr:hypothetical protein [candidate division WOR-3 bacterium]